MTTWTRQHRESLLFRMPWHLEDPTPSRLSVSGRQVGPEGRSRRAVLRVRSLHLVIQNLAIPPGFEHADGILGKDVYRFYFADITYSGEDHLLALKVEASDPDDLEATVSRLGTILETATFPARPTER